MNRKKIKISHHEKHKPEHIGWLRAAVLGANDGLVSTASLIIGMAAGGASHENVLLAGVAGLAAGAMSMAAGEYVSVSSQADIEAADIAREKIELELHPDHELDELAGIYVKRGLSKDLAHLVARELTEHDALGAHIRDELGLAENFVAKPIQAALTSAATFSIGALLPLVAAYFSPLPHFTFSVGATCLFSLAGLGFFSAKIGSAPILKAVARVTFWGAFAMLLTAFVGSVTELIVL